MFEGAVAALIGSIWGGGLPFLLRHLGIHRSVTREVAFFWIVICAVFSALLVLTWQGTFLHLVLLWLFLGCLTLQGAMDWSEGVVDDSVTAFLCVLALASRVSGWGCGWFEGILVTVGVMGCSVLLAWRQCLGWGDVALLAVLAFLLGRELLILLFYALVPAGMVAALLLFTRRIDRKDQWPLVPWLVFGFVLTLVFPWRPW